MKPKTYLFFTSLIVAGGLLIAAMSWMLKEPEPPWSASSVEAREAFEAGLKDWMKAYYSDASRHFERALEIDPDFAIAKMFSSFVTYGHEERYKRYLEELRQTDLEPLTPRERFLISYWLAQHQEQGGQAEATRLADTFLAAHPDDPFAINTRCVDAWERESWDEAETCYQELIERHPNWVTAQNRLGYIAMAQGRFSEAEEHFHTYRYVAPDQANPYDSLGQLLTFIGRYEAAEEALHEAIRIKVDFCDAYFHLVRLYNFWGQNDKALQVMADLSEVESCTWPQTGFGCCYGAWSQYLEGDVEGAWQTFREACADKPDSLNLLSHRLAIMTGRKAEALAAEESYRQRLAEGVHEKAEFWYRASLVHMEGVRLLVEGKAAEATSRFRNADDLLRYWGHDLATFKLFNRLNLLYSLKLAGADKEAAALRRQIEAVNPRYFEGPHMRDLEALLRESTTS